MPDPTPTPDAPARFSRAWWLAQLMLLLPTNWRQVVQWLILIAIFSLYKWIGGKDAVPLPIPDPPIPVFDFVVSQEMDLEPDVIEELHKRKVKVRRTGWRMPTQEEREAAFQQMPVPRWQNTEAAEHVGAVDDDAPVWRFHEKVTGKPVPSHDQGQIGSCVSFGTALACELSLAAKINGKRGPPQAYSENVREAIYGGSRINADPKNPIRGGDGSTGSRAALWLQKGVGGLLPVGDNGPYTVKRAREWGNSGVPSNLIATCKTNPCQTTLVSSADQARQANQQGYSLFVCSNVGFGQSGPYRRDADGFLRASGQWNHCMCIAGYQGGKRPGFLIVNSWGEKWVEGPTGKYADIPPGSFWADYATVDRMLKQQDSYAVADVDGFKKRKIDPNDWIVRNAPAQKERFFDAIFALAP